MRRSCYVHRRTTTFSQTLSSQLEYYTTYDCEAVKPLYRGSIVTICYWLENARKPTRAKLADAFYAMGRRGLLRRFPKDVVS